MTPTMEAFCGPLLFCWDVYYCTKRMLICIQHQFECNWLILAWSVVKLKQENGPCDPRHRVLLIVSVSLCCFE